MSDFIDALVNKICPDQDIASLIAPFDTTPEAEMVYADDIGLKIVQHIKGSVLTSDSDRFTDSTNSPFSIADIGRYIEIKSGGSNDQIVRIKAFIDASNVDCEKPDDSDPGFTDETDITYAIHEEPNLEDSINYRTTQIRNIIDPSKSYNQDMPRGFDPADTDNTNIKKEKMSLKVLADNWLGSKMEIIDKIVPDITVAATNTGKLLTTSLAYADPDDRRGLIIQSSTGNTYQDEVALASIVKGKHKVILIDKSTYTEFQDSSGEEIYGVLQDGADNSGSGEATDVFLKFVHDVAGVPTNYTWGADDPTSIIAYIPYRSKSSEILEYERRIFRTAAITGDAELAEDIQNLWSILGIGDGDDAGDLDLINTGNYYPFSELTLGTATLEDILNKLNEEIGDRTYTEQNVVTNGETISNSLNELDKALASAGIKSKIVYRVTSPIVKGTIWTIPFASGSDPLITTYKQDTGHRGLYCDLLVGGKKRVPDSSGVAVDGEYEESSTTQFRFRFTVHTGQIIEILIKDNA